MSTLPTVTSESFSAVKEAPAAIVDFWAEWCPPCRELKPVIAQVAQDLHDRVLIVGANVEDASELAKEYAVMSIPTLIFFKNGREVHRTSGAISRIELMLQIQKHLGV